MTRSVSDQRHERIDAWLAEHATGPVVVLCAEAPGEVAQGRLGVRLESCLAATPAYRLVDLLIAAGHPLVIARAGCRLPEPAWLTTVARIVGERRIATVDPVPPGPRGLLADLSHPPVSRRGLLGVFGGDAAQPAHAAIDEAGRLVESLRRLGTIDGDTEAPARALSLTACTACGLCVRVCPHEALDLTHAGTISTLTHAPDRCQGELVCVEACPVAGRDDNGALPWRAVVSGEPRVLGTLETSTCVRCGARTTAGELCEPCAFRRENPFGWSPPPIARR